ncbi:hypothetical protein M422DRAFT_247237 [Sphaerobolus stellatus SS14]|nr:hypothetical protein M422DRAFT_247237 [Sphaerobolus stellatus SS14]
MLWGPTLRAFPFLLWARRCVRSPSSLGTRRCVRSPPSSKGPTLRTSPSSLWASTAACVPSPRLIPTPRAFPLVLPGNSATPRLYSNPRVALAGQSRSGGPKMYHGMPAGTTLLAELIGVSYFPFLRAYSILPGPQLCLTLIGSHLCCGARALTILPRADRLALLPRTDRNILTSLKLKANIPTYCGWRDRSFSMQQGYLTV